MNQSLLGQGQYVNNIGGQSILMSFHYMFNLPAGLHVYSPFKTEINRTK